MQRCGPLLQNAAIAADPMPESPPQPISSEAMLQAHVVAFLLGRTRRALRATFAGQLNSRELTITLGSNAFSTRRFMPDLAHCRPASQVDIPNAANRVVGEIKPSWKWASVMGLPIIGGGPSTRGQRKFKQALSQVNFYMRQQRTRYGYILTDCEFVAIRRRDGQGNLELASPIPWDQSGTVHNPRTTVLLALWYLGFLASHEEGPLSWRMQN